MRQAVYSSDEGSCLKRDPLRLQSCSLIEQDTETSEFLGRCFWRGSLEEVSTGLA